MFVNFFYMLRDKGIPVSPKSFLLLQKALGMGLIRSLEDFYIAARALLIKSERYFDVYDTVFAGAFRGVVEVEPTELELTELARALLDEWLKNPAQMAQALGLPEEALKKMTPEEFLESSIASGPATAGTPFKNILIVFAVIALLTGGALSWLASTRPDGLEWSIAKITGKGELAQQTQGIAAALRKVQEKTAFLPDYNFPSTSPGAGKDEKPASWPQVEAGTSVAGLLGSAIVLGLIVLIGFGIRTFKKRKS